MDGLDLVEEEDQCTHMVGMDDELDPQDRLGECLWPPACCTAATIRAWYARMFNLLTSWTRCQIFPLVLISSICRRVPV